ncbi:RNA polymerase I associated factor, A49-like protein [Aulographum hederae CBS 113979]|uniref:RNA polymerase I associated factor, A49-like protein n=1 Tax=Aulographum hederae CBS 113979 TaxID=1176131 RepID=A0A6G1GYH6_9PEZI|nr:RNA polymerase I associated factor, A49-like protein [Aulographum hederae CBS 113979]
MSGDKKRKRQSEDGEPSQPTKSKKVAFEKKKFSDTDPLIITHHPEEDIPGAVILTGLELPENITLKPYVSDKSTAAAKRPLFLHSSEHPILDYVARAPQDNSCNQHRKHYIAVYDPETNKLDFHHTQLLELKAIPRMTQEEIDEEQEAEKNRTSRAAAREALGLAFGTKKAKKNIGSVTENAITSGEITSGLNKDDLVEAAVLKQVEETTKDMPTKEDLQATADDTKPRPKPNLGAIKFSDVYTAKDVIGEEILALISVKPWLEVVEKKENIKLPFRFIAHRMTSLAQKKEIRRLKVLRYLHMLLSFNQLLKPIGRTSGKKLPSRKDIRIKAEMPDAIADGVIRKFCDGKEMTKWHVDYLMTHICVFALIVDDFETDIKDLQEDLRLDQKQMTQYFQEVGARVSALPASVLKARGMSKEKGAAHRIAKLRLPLDFPVVGRGPGRRR